MTVPLPTCGTILSQKHLLRAEEKHIIVSHHDGGCATCMQTRPIHEYVCIVFEWLQYLTKNEYALHIFDIFIQCSSWLVRSSYYPLSCWHLVVVRDLVCGTSFISKRYSKCYSDAQSALDLETCFASPSHLSSASFARPRSSGWCVHHVGILLVNWGRCGFFLLMVYSHLWLCVDIQAIHWLLLNQNAIFSVVSHYVLYTNIHRLYSIYCN